MRILIIITCTENDGKCLACMFDVHHHPFGLHGKRLMWLKSDPGGVMLALSDANKFFQRPPPSCVCAGIVLPRAHWHSQEELNNKKADMCHYGLLWIALLNSLFFFSVCYDAKLSTKASGLTFSSVKKIKS